MLENFQQYFYFIGVSLLLPIWVVMFSRKERRNDMLFVGSVFGIGATILGVLYSNIDYWHPVYIIKGVPLEEFYYGFVFGGISSELYEIVFGKRSSLRKTKPQHWNLFLWMVALLVPSFLIFVHVLGWNSIISLLFPLLFSGILIAILRKDLLIPQLWSGVLLTLLTYSMFMILLLIYPDMIRNHWLLGNLSGVLVSGLPIEELIFAFSVGFASGHVFEFFGGYSVVPAKKS